jgi:hypothetical protein
MHLKTNNHIQETTDLKMILMRQDSPIRPSNSNNYKPNNFALELFKFFTGL